MPLSREDRWLTLWIAAAFALGLLLSGLNAVLWRYTTIFYFPRVLWPLLPVSLYFAYWNLPPMLAAPRTAFVVRNCALYGLSMIALAYLVTGLQATPFAPIDSTLLRWDRALGFDTAAALCWTARHPGLRRFLDACYASTDFQLALAPLIPGLAFDRRRMRVYLHGIVYAFIAGGLIYYFFPSSGPSSVCPSPDFPWAQRLTWTKYYMVHHRLPVDTIQGGMIAFPSFHVAWALQTTYAALPWKRGFPLVAALNVLVVLSTLLLGWHYLVDVPAGLALGALGLAAGAATHRAFQQDGAVAEAPAERLY